MKAPVLLLLFNRPKLAARLLQRLRPERPARLYVAVDGPRPPGEGVAGEHALCRASQAAVEAVDWPCRVERLFRKRNLGCGLAVSEAISWFFEREEEGVILEDDVLPSPSFFRFCDTMLEKFRRDPQVMMVSGNNFSYNAPLEPMPWFFTSYPQIWGWASWARAWKHFRLQPEDTEFFLRERLPGIAGNRDSLLFWSRALRAARDHPRSVWGYQWCKAVLERKGLCVAPGINLAANSGFGAGASHTGKGRAVTQSLQAGNYGQLGQGPVRSEADAAYDAYLSRFFFARRAPCPADWLEEIRARMELGASASALGLLNAVERSLVPWREGEPEAEFRALREGLDARSLAAT